MEYNLSMIFNQTTSVNKTGAQTDVFPLRNWEFIWIWVITLLAVTGNAVILYVTRRSRPSSTHSLFNLWLASLATSDLVLSIIYLPTYVLSTSIYNHPGGVQGDLLCKLFTGYTATYCLQGVSIMQLVGISIERLRLITNPSATRTKGSKSSQRTKFMIASAWIFPFLISFPPNVVYKTYSTDRPTIGNHCAYKSKRSNDMVYRIMSRVLALLLFYLVPLFVLVYSSLRIKKSLDHLKRAFEDQDMRSNRLEARMLLNLESQRKTTLLTLLLLVGAFAVFWTPFWIMHFSLVFDNSIVNKEYFQTCALLAFSNSFVDCVLYAFLSGEFRKHFCLTFPNAARLLKFLGFACNRIKSYKIKKRSKTPLTTSYDQARGNARYGAISC